MLPLQLSYSLVNYGQFLARKRSKTFQAIASKILARDKQTCQFCGFQASKFQEVVNIDQNYRNNVLDNMVTACCFCTQCFFLESVGEQGYGGGTLLYFPEINQAELNALCHVLFFAIFTNSEHKEPAQAILQTMRMRSGVVDKLLGEGMSEPANLAQLLLDSAGNKPSPEITNILSNLRILPSRGRFAKNIEYWAKQAGGS